ncbi:hypothetical protein PR202_ga30288 [Eleusine coracana subsp. coracana]|uniref:DUF7597 domain-containing protein n=1 Tax=Eleusine coracana subsp. coracana TaxID=191504 RepID=A0AAV5DPB2_ELECO|nr:hypothetical protein PR202_ga30288 [Eleusine coracana subsp. coracana]
MASSVLKLKAVLPVRLLRPVPTAAAVLLPRRASPPAVLAVHAVSGKARLGAVLVAAAGAMDDPRPAMDEYPEGILSGEWPDNFSLLSYDDLRAYLESQIVTSDKVANPLVVVQEAIADPLPATNEVAAAAVASAMAYQRADPTPFMPVGFHHIQVQNQQLMTHAITWRPLRRHKDWALVLIEPFPQHQGSHLGQALVRFESVYDRDHLVNMSPHQFGDVQLTFLRHDQGRNFRSLNFNRECWFMLLGFPLDYRAQGHVESAIAPFGRMTFWEDDRTNLSRILVRARVTDLVDVPQFVVLTDGEGFQGFSWTIQVAPPNEQMPFNPAPEPELALQIQPEPVEEPAKAWDLNVPVLAAEPMEVEDAQADFPQHQGEIDLNVEPHDEPMEHKEPHVFVEDNDSDSDDDAETDEEIIIDDPPK